MKPMNKPQGTLKTALPVAYAYPQHCRARTRLSCFGWHCAGCNTYLPFRDEQGRTLQQIQQGAVLTQVTGPATEEA